MNFNIRSMKILFLLVSVCLLLAETSYAGLSFLKIGAGGRAVGMGEAYTALSNDASATYWNPAGLTGLSRSEFMFTHNQWFQDISHDFLSFAFLAGRNRLGVSFITTNIAGIERRTSASTDPLETIEAHDIMLGLSFARSHHDLFSWGITVKYLYEKIYLETSAGIAFDLGVIYPLPWKGLTVAAVAQNLGSMSKLKNESIQLPVTFKTGFAYQLPLNLSGRVSISGDAIKIRDNRFHTNWGVEYEFKHVLALRFGYLTGYDERNFQTGAGLRFNRYRLDYGYVPFASDLGNSHRISLGIQF